MRYREKIHYVHGGTTVVMSGCNEHFHYKRSSNSRIAPTSLVHGGEGEGEGGDMLTHERGRVREERRERGKRNKRE